MQLTLLSLDSDFIRVQCEGRISQQSITPGSTPFETLLGMNCFRHKVLLNLEKTHYIDSSGISWLMTQHKQFLKGGGILILYAVPPMVNQVLQLLRMSLILNIAADEAAAQTLIQGGKS
jgi:ABC-type transporter Mla MlaB component